MFITHSPFGYVLYFCGLYQCWLVEYLKCMSLVLCILQFSISLSEFIHLLTHYFQTILTRKKSFSWCVEIFKQLPFWWIRQTKTVLVILWMDKNHTLRYKYNCCNIPVSHFLNICYFNNRLVLLFFLRIIGSALLTLIRFHLVRFEEHCKLCQAHPIENIIRMFQWTLMWWTCYYSIQLLYMTLQN